MSEYQFYEFRAIDQPLSPDQLAKVAELSSRAELDQHQAKFVYNYGNFRADPKKVLAKYYDAMIYLANWGTKRLMFRFPESAINIDDLRKYCFQKAITVEIIGGFVILDMRFQEDEPNYHWIDGEGWLSHFLSLRNDILMQDYRILYLAWLRAVSIWLEYRDDYDAIIHPPVPAGLSDLSMPLQKFVDSFDLDLFLVQEAAKISPDFRKFTKQEIQDAIRKLTPEECHNYLFKLASGEPNLYTQLNVHLKKTMLNGSNIKPTGTKQLSFKELFQNARLAEKQEAERQRVLKEEKRKERLEGMKEKEPQLWEKAEALIARKKTSAYDEAVEILLQLKELAEYKGKQIGFQERINQFHKTYSRLPSLRHRMESVGLTSN